MNPFENLLKALDLLNSLLKAKNITADLTIVGSMSIYLNNYKIDRFTEDIDYLDYVPGEEFSSAVLEVAKTLNLKKDWINSKTGTIDPLPVNLHDNLTIDTRFSHITMKIISREVLIEMKVYAAYMRGAIDLEDLMLLSPGKLEIKNGIEYLKKTILKNHGKKHLNKSRKDILDFERFLNEQFN